jgi:hypothetical protein
MEGGGGGVDGINSLIKDAFSFIANANLIKYKNEKLYAKPVFIVI